MSNAWLIASLVTLAGHGGLAAWLDQHQPAPRDVRPKVMRFQVISVPPAPERVDAPRPPDPPPPPPPPPPKLVKRARPRPRPIEPPEPEGPTRTDIVDPAASGLSPDQSAAQGELAVEAGGGIDGAVQEGTGSEKTRVDEPIAAPPPRPARKYVPIFEVTQMPRALRPVQPDVPDGFASAKREAVVVVEVAISASGRVVEARVVKKAGFGLDEAALAAARKTRFEPALIGARPVAVRMQIPYRFKVRE